MDDHHTPTNHHADASRPALGFPLGTALLLIVIFCISGLFSCCYHWDKLRSLRRSFSATADADPDATDLPSKATLIHVDVKQNQSQSLPVLMPGDQMPKYIAWPCPCEPSLLEKITVEIQSPPPPPPPPPPS